MQLQVTVNQKEALRRGINAPFSTAKIEVDPASLSQEVRDMIASYLKDGYDLTYYNFGSVIEPTQAGIVAKAEEHIAKKKAEEQAKIEREKLESQLIEKAISAARANPLLAIRFTNCSLGKDFTDEDGAAMKLADVWVENGAKAEDGMRVDGHGWVKVTWPDDVRTSIDAAVDRINLTANAIRKNRADAAHKAQVDRLSPHFTDEEKEMFARDYLDLDAVEHRLDEEAIDAIREMIEPPDYEIETGGSAWADRKPSSADEFRLLKRIEQLTSRPGKLVSRWARGTRWTRVQIETTTADGRTLQLAIGLPEGED